MSDDRFGRRMRSEREQRRIALESIAARTKISIGLLSDLEHDQLSRWPRGIFRRAFVRSYAEAIGLDPDEALREFLEQHPDLPEPLAPVRALSTQVAAANAVARITAAPAAPPVAARQCVPLRLTLADTPRAFSGGPILIGVRRRLAAAAWDAGWICALTALVRIGLFRMGVDQFWAPFGAVMLSYQVCSILALGNTPGVYLFAPSATHERHSGATTPSVDGEPSDVAASSIFEPRATART